MICWIEDLIYAMVVCVEKIVIALVGERMHPIDAPADMKLREAPSSAWTRSPFSGVPNPYPLAINEFDYDPKCAYCGTRAGYHRCKNCGAPKKHVI